MNIGEIYLFVNFELNKYQSGSFAPDEFNQVLTATYLDPFKIKIGLPEEYQFPSAKGGGSEARQNYQAGQTITDDLRLFIKTTPVVKARNGFFPYPADYVRHSASEYDKITNVNDCGAGPLVETQPIEPVTDEQKKFRKNNTVIRPDNDNPIISFEDGGFLIDPQNITQFRLTYLRLPAKPVFGYFFDPVTQEVTYDPSTSVQLEYPVIMHNDYCAMLIKYIALNIRDKDAEAFGEKRQITGQ